MASEMLQATAMKLGVMHCPSCGFQTPKDFRRYLFRQKEYKSKFDGRQEKYLSLYTCC